MDYPLKKKSVIQKNVIIDLVKLLLFFFFFWKDSPVSVILFSIKKKQHGLSIHPLSVLLIKGHEKAGVPNDFG